jgi:hypothetical protein
MVRPIVDALINEPAVFLAGMLGLAGSLGGVWLGSHLSKKAAEELWAKSILTSRSDEDSQRMLRILSVVDRMLDYEKRYLERNWSGVDIPGIPASGFKHPVELMSIAIYLRSELASIGLVENRDLTDGLRRQVTGFIREWHDQTVPAYFDMKAALESRNLLATNLGDSKRIVEFKYGLTTKPDGSSS